MEVNLAPCIKIEFAQSDFIFLHFLRGTSDIWILFIIIVFYILKICAPNPRAG